MDICSNVTKSMIESDVEKQPLLCRQNKNLKEPIWRQYTAAYLSSLISFSTGCVGGWSSPATPILLNDPSALGLRLLTVEEASWVGSLINLGAVFGSIPTGYLSFKWGRKTCLLALAWPVIIGWLLILFNNNNVWIVYLGRFISGLSYGGLNVALPIYNNEICSDRIRGRIGISYDLMQSLGLLWVYFFAFLTSLFWTTIFCLLIPIIFFLTFLWMPESPLFLLRRGKKKEAIKSIKWLRGDDCDVEMELHRIHLALAEGKTEGLNSDLTDNENESGYCSLFQYCKTFYQSLSKVTVRTVLIAFFLFVLQRSCGATMVQYYADNIFQLAHSVVPANLATVLIGVVSVIGSIMSILTVDSIGRRFLLIFTFFVMTLSLGVFVAYLIFIWNENDVINATMAQNPYGVIPAVTLCLFAAMFRFGVSPVPWFLAPEIIPTEAQKWAPSAIVCITWGTSFLFSKSFLPSIEAFGQVPVYSFFLIVTAIGTLYTWILIPETKNKSREEIQRDLRVAVSCYESTKSKS